MKVVTESTATYTGVPLLKQPKTTTTKGAKTFKNHPEDDEDTPNLHGETPNTFIGEKQNHPVLFHLRYAIEMYERPLELITPKKKFDFRA